MPKQVIGRVDTDAATLEEAVRYLITKLLAMLPNAGFYKIIVRIEPND